MAQKWPSPILRKNSGFPENRGKLVKIEVFRDFLGNYNRDFVHFASECRGERYRADAKDRSSKPFQEVEIFEVIRGFSALSEKFSEIRKIFFCIFDIYMLQFAKICNKKIFHFFSHYEVILARVLKIFQPKKKFFLIDSKWSNSQSYHVKMEIGRHFGFYPILRVILAWHLENVLASIQFLILGGPW